MSSSDRPEYVQQNVANWTRANADYTDTSATRAWDQEEITWGVFEAPESELNLLGDVDGIEVVERLPIEIPPHQGTIHYLRTKQQKLGHLFSDLTPVSRP